MAAEKINDPPSGSVDAIPKADEFGKAMNWNTTGGFHFPSPFQASERTPMIENLKIDNDGSFSINTKLPDGGSPAIFSAWRNYDPEIENQKVIRFLNARMSTEFPGGDNKVMVVKVANLPPGIENKDMEIAVEIRKLVVELNAVPPILELYGRIRRFAEFPVGVTGSVISTLLEDQTLTVTVALKKLQPEEKPKSIFSKIKGAAKKAWPAFLAVGGKMLFDDINDDDAN